MVPSSRCDERMPRAAARSLAAGAHPANRGSAFCDPLATCNSHAREASANPIPFGTKACSCTGDQQWSTWLP